MPKILQAINFHSILGLDENSFLGEQNDLRGIPGWVLDALNSPAGRDGELPATGATLKIELHHGAVGGADAVTMFSHVAFAAAMPAIAVFFPLLQHFLHHEFLLAPTEFSRKTWFAPGHPAGVKAGFDRKDRFADKGAGHEKDVILI
jgi:hypothetical protein